MITSMRKISNKSITKILLGGLVLVFVSFGFGGFKSSKNTLVSIDGNSAILLEEFLKEKRVITQSIAKYYPNVDPDSFNVNQLTLNQLIRNKLIALEVKNLGLKISDSLALDAIKSNKMFQSDKGDFDKNLFKRILSSNRISEVDYLNGVKLSIAASFLGKNMLNFNVPEYVVRQVSLYDNQERDIELFEINNQTPVVVDDKSAHEFYEANKNLFYIPEKRDVDYIVISSSKENFQQIESIERLLEEGKNLKEISVKYKLVLKTAKNISSVGAALPRERGKDEISDPKILDEIFSASENMPSEVIKVNDSYYVVSVTKIHPRYLQNFVSVKKDIVNRLKYEKLSQINAKLATDVRSQLIKNPSAAIDEKKVLRRKTTLKRPEGNGHINSIPMNNVIAIFSFDKPGEYTDVFKFKGGNFGFAKLRSILNPSEKFDKKSHENLNNVFSEIVNQSFLAFLYKKYNVQINYNALKG